MNGILLRTLLLIAAASLLPALALAGCEDLNLAQMPEVSSAQTTTDSSTTTESSTTILTSQTPPETVPAVTTTVAKPKSAPTTTTTLFPVVTGLQFQLLPLVSTRYEETDPHLIWAGSWNGSSHPSCSGGTARFAPHVDDWVVVRFSGASISLVVVSSSVSGVARITVDGGSPVFVDTFSATDQFQRVVWSSGGLGNGSHEVTVGPAGYGDLAGPGFSHIVIDAFDIVGTLE